MEEFLKLRQICFGKPFKKQQSHPLIMCYELIQAEVAEIDLGRCLSMMKIKT